ncbi:unnamed protein product [Allacma fusca]|uniref:Uncharacterized protein n=1 Tax=Allacma fusca TaxID=39272 RepID=A0A8J2L3L9_9HEXA|nr:unnamed protein product [Allacma fusca]
MDGQDGRNLVSMALFFNMLPHFTHEERGRHRKRKLPSLWASHDESWSLPLVLFFRYHYNGSGLWLPPFNSVQSMDR